MKKIMLLGGNYYQATATKAAKALGHYVISVDYRPNAPAHKFADEYVNVSTTDKDAVLELARKLKIDGIASYASDFSANTAAYVAEKLGLPTNPYSSVEILTRKDLMREFLKTHGFNVPKCKSFKEFSGVCEFAKDFPCVIVKPVDASGSQGVTRVDDAENLLTAFEYAMSFSPEKIVIVEQFLTRDGFQFDGDGFIVNGKLVFFGIGNEHFDNICNPHVIIGESFPANLSKERRELSFFEIQRLLSLLNMKQGAINIEFIFDNSGKLYILEIGPRNGGTLITDAIKLSTGIDLAKYTVLAALGEDCSDLTDAPFNRFISSFVIHSIHDGQYSGVKISPEIGKDLLLWDMFVGHPEQIRKYNNVGSGIGAMLIRHKSMEEMLYRMENMEQFISVNTL